MFELIDTYILNCICELCRPPIFNFFFILADPSLSTVVLIRQACVRLSSVTLCIMYVGFVAKRCVLEQKLLLTAYRKSCVGNRLVPK